MRIISKFIFWISTLLLVFILVNLFVWLYKFWSVSDYINYLNQKDYKQTVSDISITQPKSFLNIFYPQNITWSNQEKKTQIDWNLDLQENTYSWEDLETTQIDPYDPKFEDEFNDFFWDDEDLSLPQKETWSQEAWFIWQ